VCILAFASNVWGIRLLPSIQLMGGICHVVFFFALSIPLILLADRSTPDFVFTTLINEGGWSSNGVSWCVGLLTVTYCFMGKASSPVPSLLADLRPGFDGAVHMSEEVRNAPVVIPRMLVQTIAINGTLAFSFILVLLFCIGDVQSVLGTGTGYPIIQIFYNATGSARAATAMQCGIIIVGFISSLGVVASVSRLTWAFARDGGLPFSPFFAHVRSPPALSTAQH
jgi:amino acid transporter